MSLLPHDDLTGHAKQSCHRGRRDAVLAGSGFGDQALLPHTPGQQGLPQGIVQFVGACMIQILPLQVDPGAPQIFRQAAGEVEGGFPAAVVPQIPFELRLEVPVFPCLSIALFQVDQGRHEGFRHVTSAKDAEVALSVR
jgi:hypothetical protein